MPEEKVGKILDVRVVTLRSSAEARHFVFPEVVIKALQSTQLRFKEQEGRFSCGQSDVNMELTADCQLNLAL